MGTERRELSGRRVAWVAGELFGLGTSHAMMFAMMLRDERVKKNIK